MNIKESICQLTGFDRVLWAVSVVVVTMAFVLSKDFNWVTLIASLTGVTALIFIAKGAVIGQLLTVIFSILYAVVSYQFRYYGEMVTYLGMTMPIAAMSVVSWLRHPYSETEVEVNHLRKKDVGLLMVLTVLVTIAFYFILKYLGTNNLTVSTFSIATSFLASGLMLLRSPYYAIAYGANDIVLILLWILATRSNLTFLPMIFCFVMFLLNDLYGFYSWNQMKKRQFDEKYFSKID